MTTRRAATIASPIVGTPPAVAKQVPQLPAQAGTSAFASGTATYGRQRQGYT
ncbi:hypothetical protein AB0M79_30015 [Polymorphospora sp. NPDC051019]|uniref:hypothetical protein n=1 Tax=Polymorphospora sp. NPDC051019 TaxID=3155725 RepID=UPI003434A8C7